MGGMLIDQDQAVGLFRNDVSLVQDADDPQSQRIALRGGSRTFSVVIRLRSFLFGWFFRFQPRQFRGPLKDRLLTQRRIIQECGFQDQFHVIRVLDIGFRLIFRRFLRRWIIYYGKRFRRDQFRFRTVRPEFERNRFGNGIADGVRHIDRAGGKIRFPGLAQGLRHGVPDGCRNFEFPRKTHFPLGRMHIHIHHRRIHPDEQDAGLIAAFVQYGSAAVPHRAVDRLRFHWTAVHEQPLFRPGGFGERTPRNVTGDLDPVQAAG